MPTPIDCYFAPFTDACVTRTGRSSGTRVRGSSSSRSIKENLLVSGLDIPSHQRRHGMVSRSEAGPKRPSGNKDALQPRRSPSALRQHRGGVGRDEIARTAGSRSGREPDQSQVQVSRGARRYHRKPSCHARSRPRSSNAPSPPPRQVIGRERTTFMPAKSSSPSRSRARDLLQRSTRWAVAARCASGSRR